MRIADEGVSDCPPQRYQLARRRAGAFLRWWRTVCLGQQRRNATVFCCPRRQRWRNGERYHANDRQRFDFNTQTVPGSFSPLTAPTPARSPSTLTALPVSVQRSSGTGSSQVLTGGEITADDPITVVYGTDDNAFYLLPDLQGTAARRNVGLTNGELVSLYCRRHVPDECHSGNQRAGIAGDAINDADLIPAIRPQQGRCFHFTLAARRTLAGLTRRRRRHSIHRCGRGRAAD